MAGPSASDPRTARDFDDVRPTSRSARRAGGSARSLSPAVRYVRRPLHPAHAHASKVRSSGSCAPRPVPRSLGHRLDVLVAASRHVTGTDPRGLGSCCHRPPPRMSRLEGRRIPRSSPATRILGASRRSPRRTPSGRAPRATRARGRRTDVEPGRNGMRREDVAAASAGSAARAVQHANRAASDRAACSPVRGSSRGLAADRPIRTSRPERVDRPASCCRRRPTGHGENPAAAGDLHHLLSRLLSESRMELADP